MKFDLICWWSVNPSLIFCQNKFINFLSCQCLHEKSLYGVLFFYRGAWRIIRSFHERTHQNHSKVQKESDILVGQLCWMIFLFLKYRGYVLHLHGVDVEYKIWSQWRDLNPWPIDYKSIALPGWATLARNKMNFLKV